MQYQFYYYGIVIICAYFIGSLHPAFFLTKKLKNEDIRMRGSNNSGASNATMVLGWKYGVLTAVLDILKGCICVTLGRMILPDDALILYTAALGAVLGHIYPFYMRFKGGKGLATLLGCLTGLHWYFFIIFGAILVIVALAANYISIGTITITILFVAYSVYIYRFSAVTAVAFLIAIIVVCKHLINIKRIKSGEEIKVWDLVRKRQKASQ